MSTAAERSKLFLSGQGTNDSTTFVDLSTGGKTLTRYGDARIRTNQYKYYGSSMYFDGVTDRIVAGGTGSPTIGAGLFTIQGWVYVDADSYGNGFSIFDCRTSDTDSAGFSFYVRGSGKLVIGYHSGSFTVIEGVNSFPLRAWVHVALTRDASGLIRIFLNGVQENTVTRTTNYNNVGWTIGANWSATSAQAGYINDLEVSPGICLYESAFTPPGPLVGFKMSGTVKDASNNPLSRVVRACRVAGLNVQQVTSDPVTGAWEMWVPNEPHSVWCIGQFGESDKIFGNVYPFTE